MQNKVPELLKFLVAMSGNSIYTIQETDLWFSIDEYANAILANIQKLVDASIDNFDLHKSKKLDGGLEVTYIPLNFNKIMTLDNVFQPSKNTENWIKPVGLLSMVNQVGPMDVYICHTIKPGTGEESAVFVTPGGTLEGEGIKLCVHCLFQLGVNIA